MTTQRSPDATSSSPTFGDKAKASLRRRLLILIGGGLIAMFLVLGLTMYALVSQAEREVRVEQQVDAARASAETISNFMDRVTESLGLLAVIDSPYLAENPERLKEWLTLNPAILEVLRVTGEGDVVAGAAQDRTILANPFTIPQSNWFLDALAGERYIGSVQISAEDQPYLILATPTADGGVIAARLNMQLLWDVVANISFGDSGSAYILDTEGRIVGHQNPQIVIEQSSVVGRPEWEMISIAPDFMWSGTYANLENQTVNGQSLQIKATDWIVITEFDQAEATQLSRFTLAFVGGLLILFGCLGLWALWQILDRQVVVPITALRQRAKRIADGQYSEQVKVAVNDEIGALSLAFNDMSTALSIRDKRIAAQTSALAKEVSERKIAQENLQRLNAELVQSSRYKDQFLATMSHELRTPLNAVLGMSEALVVPVYGELNPQQLKAIRHIQESGQHLLSLIDDILDLSKISAGKSPLEIVPVIVEPVIKASLRMVRPTVLAKNLNVTSNIDPNVTALMADERRLKQVLVNLLNNAVKFTDNGGDVGIEVEGNAAEGIVRFTVWDSGIGIPKDAMSHLFEPFTQLDGGLARQYGGTGLGLALVNRLVDMHGGSISVTSEEGKGSRFIIQMPWSEPVQPHEEEKYSIFLNGADGTLSAAKGATILLAEDREANILTILDYLTVKGFDVNVARNGREAVEMTELINPSLILMDIQMPEMNGLDAIRVLRANLATRNIPIVALTALAMPGDRERCLEAGANDYLSKPVSLRKLVRVIEEQLTPA